MNALTHWIFGEGFETNTSYVAISYLLGLLFSFLVWIYGDWWGLFVVIILLIALDTFVGFLAAWKYKRANSDDFFYKLFRKCGVYVAFLALAAILDFVLQLTITNGIDIFDISQLSIFGIFLNPFILFATVAIFIKEVWSILENIEIIDSTLVPPIFKQILDKIRKLIFKIVPEEEKDEKEE